MRVLIVDDHAVVRVGLRNVLCEHGTVATGEAASGAEALARLRTGAWDLVILDIGLPDRSGLDLLKDIHRDYPTLPVIVLTMYPEEPYAVRVFRAGAAGFLAKNSVPEELVDAVRTVASGGRYVTPALAGTPFGLFTGRMGGHKALSHRELQVLQMIAAGKRVADIATILGLSVKTISSHRTNILEKMCLHTTAELIQYALHHGLVP